MLKVRRSSDFFSGALFFSIGSAFAVGATAHRIGSAAEMGPGYAPFFFGCLLALLGISLVVRSVTGAKAENEADRKPWVWRPLLFIAAAIVLAGVTLPTMGLFVSLPVVVLTTSFASRHLGWREALSLAIGLTAFVWLIFVKALGLQIPLMPFS